MSSGQLSENVFSGLGFDFDFDIVNNGSPCHGFLVHCQVRRGSVMRCVTSSTSQRDGMPSESESSDSDNLPACLLTTECLRKNAKGCMTRFLLLRTPCAVPLESVRHSQERWLLSLWRVFQFHVLCQLQALFRDAQEFSISQACRF